MIDLNRAMKLSRCYIPLGKQKRLKINSPCFFFPLFLSFYYGRLAIQSYDLSAILACLPIQSSESKKETKIVKEEDENKSTKRNEDGGQSSTELKIKTIESFDTVVYILHATSKLTCKDEDGANSVWVGS